MSDYTRRRLLGMRATLSAKLENEWAELQRRNQESTVVDGYPSSTRGSDGGRGSDVSRPTEAAAQRLVEGRRTDDPLASACESAERHLKDAHKALNDFVNTVRNALDLGEMKRGRQSTVSECVRLGCGEAGIGTTDKPARRGMCGRCYGQWLKAGKPDLCPVYVEDEAGRRVRDDHGDYVLRITWIEEAA